MSFMDVRVIDPDVALEVVLDLLRGQGGMVVMIHCGDVRIEDHGDSEDREEAAGGGEGTDFLAQGGEETVDYRLVEGNHQAEVVLPAVAGDSVRLSGDFVNALREADQELFALHPAVQVLKKFEMLDIDGDHAPLGFPVLHLFLGHDEEGLLAEQVGHHVPQAAGGDTRIGPRAFLAPPYFLDIVQVEMNRMVLQGVFGSADQQRLHLPPGSVQGEIADYAAENPAGPGAGKPLLHISRVHQGMVRVPVFRMDHVGGGVFDQGRITIVKNGREELAVRMITGHKVIFGQIDDHQIIIGGMHQPLGQLFRRRPGDQIRQE